MKLLPLFLGLLHFVCADHLHKLKLHKIPSVATNPELESAYLAEKYGAAQVPLLGGSSRIKRPTMRDGEQLLWTQEHMNGGHPVPLTSIAFYLTYSEYSFTLPPRFHECAVLHGDHPRYSSSESESTFLPAALN